MQGVYSWVSSIVYYMVFATMVVNLLPSGKYEKYLRLFAGCILILLVIQPLTGGLRLEEKIAGIFKSLSFEIEAEDLNADLAGMEEKRLSALIDRYEEAAAEDLSHMPFMEGYAEPAVSMEIEQKKDSPDFGKIKHITVNLSEKQKKREEENTKTTGGIVKPVEAVNIEVGEQNADHSSAVTAVPENQEIEGIIRLKKEIAEYYQVEEEHVEIKLQNE